MWGYAFYRGKNVTAGETDYTGVDIYLGLRAIVVRECSQVGGWVAIARGVPE